MSKKNIRFAFKRSLPVFFGYIFLGTAFGVLMQQAGYNVLWSMGTSAFVYAGSAQFLLVSLLTAGSSIATVAVLIRLINSRHIYYGLSFIEKFKNSGKYAPYMIFSLTDETYSVLCSCEYPDYIDENKVNFFIALFDQIYWILGSVLGGIAGQLIPFDLTGIDFSMTALFIVIFVDQWQHSKIHLPAIIGIISSIICILIFGAGKFILPSLIITVAVLLIMRPIISGMEAAK